MASGPTDGAKERQRYIEGKVYRRRVFRGTKRNPNVGDTVASATTNAKDNKVPTTTVTNDIDDNKNINNDEAKSNVLAQPVVPQLAVSEDGDLAQAEGSSRLEDGNSPQQQLEDQNLGGEQVSSRTGDGNSPQRQLKEQNLAQPQASLRTGDENSPQQLFQDQKLVGQQVGSRTEDGNSPQQLKEKNLAQPQANLRTDDGNSPQQNLEDQKLVGQHVSSRTEDGNSPQQQLKEQDSAQPQASLRTGDGNSPQQLFEGQSLGQPQTSSRTGDGNSPQQLFEDQSLGQPQTSSRTGDGNSPQLQFEDQNLAQAHVSSRAGDKNSPRPQSSTHKDVNSPQPQENSRPDDGNISQLEVSSRLEDGSLPHPELISKLDDRASLQQDNSVLEDEDLSQPQVNLGLDEGSSLQPLVNSTLEDQNLAQPPSPPVSDHLHSHQQPEPSNVNIRREDDRSSSPIHNHGAISDDLHNHQQAEPSNPNVQQEDDGPLSPIYGHGAVPSTGYRHSENMTVEPSQEDRFKINLALKSKQEKQEIRWKLENELGVVRNLVKKIEVKQGHVGAYGNSNVGVYGNSNVGAYGNSNVGAYSNSNVGAYGNSNVVLGGGISNGGGAKRAHSEVASAGVSRQPTRPLHQLSFPMFHNSQGVGENVEKEKRMPKANQFYHNSEFLLAKDKFPPAESNKKSKLNWKKQGGGEMGPGLRMGSKFFKSCSSLLEKLMKHKHGWVFNSPVDVEGLGLHDYFTIITHPMDLGTVKTRLNKNWYKSPKEFAEDVRLTFDNAMTYNPEGQDVHVMAEQLSKVFEDRWAIIESDYNREMRFGMEYGAPSPLPRRAPTFTPPPLDMRRILDRSESLARTPRSMNNTPSSRTPAPKKPKAKDPNKRDMTFDEKQKLSTNLQGLPPEKLDAIVHIIKRRNLALNQHDDEIEVDIDSVDAETLWELDRFVTNYKKSLSKNKRRAEVARARAEALQNSIQRSQPPAMIEISREPQADERNVPPSLPMQGGSQADNRSRSSSSSSSSSDSGSSSSDSDSDSSSASGSDAGSQGT
ncbi:transcription factor GTE4-like [Vicia villosa]|uniref:transcription factor GTE4-like n=1 Tax=Vicia villosa TaxID=3911 RepID=UPI00273CABFE|nr:transcription factor GTE4-like [Vicia villosa]XP_058756216.1 transcription factor GTE4-like [Vicia villosa]